MSKIYKLSELVERVKVGFVGSINAFYTSKELGIPIIRTTDITERGIMYSSLKYVTKDFHQKNKKSQLEEGDLIVARHGENGQVNIFTKNFECQVLNAVVIKPNNKLIDSLSLKYILQSPYIIKQIMGCVKGSVQGVINTAHISDLRIPFNKCLDYSSLYLILSKIDNKIDNNNKINAELEAMAKTLYDYWFVQFDFPDANGKPYKSSGGKMVYNDKLKREIPEGWEVKSFANLIDHDKNGDWGKDAEEGNYTQRVYCIRGADINGLNGKGELKAPERYILEKNLGKSLDSHDVIIEISGGSPSQSTGRLAYITDETLSRFDAPIICSNFCKALTLKNDDLLYNFVFEWNRAYDNDVLFGFEGKTSGIKNLLFDSFVESYHVALPKEADLVQRFYNFMLPIQSKQQANLKQNQELAALRDWLLPMLTNGQVTVGDAAYTIQETLSKVAEP